MFKYIPLGDSAFLIKIGDQITVEINQQIRTLFRAIKEAEIKGIVELVPAYNELMIAYDPLIINYKSLLIKLKDIENEINIYDLPEAELIHIPVCYDINFAPDIELVAKKNKITPKSLIQIHSTPVYLAYMLGFTPGFCYLGGMNDKIAMPRKENPRQKIEAGSVGIAGKQTGIYPIDSPGGWQLIGKTPVRLFDYERNPIFLVEAGNYLKFEPISKTEFIDIQDAVLKGVYEIRKELYHG